MKLDTQPIEGETVMIGENRPALRFVQTSDYRTYLPMLRLVERTNIPFSERHKIQYTQFIGIKRGHCDWHATYNRIFLLCEAFDAGYEGWVLYADADCYVQDLDFPVFDYLGKFSSKALIVATGGDGRCWAVNSGVFFLNLGHPLGSKIVELWHSSFVNRVSDSALADPGAIWGNSITDQVLLHDILREHSDILAATHVDDGSTLNYRGRFLRQALRAYHSSMSERLAHIESETAGIMSGTGVNLHGI